MKINIYCGAYFAQLILELEIVQTNFVEIIQTHILCSATFFKPCPLRGSVEKYL
jgi:hypothetical protein